LGHKKVEIRGVCFRDGDLVSTYQDRLSVAFGMVENSIEPAMSHHSYSRISHE